MSLSGALTVRVDLRRGVAADGRISSKCSSDGGVDWGTDKRGFWSVVFSTLSSVMFGVGWRWRRFLQRVQCGVCRV